MSFPSFQKLPVWSPLAFFWLIDINHRVVLTPKNSVAAAKSDQVKMENFNATSREHKNLVDRLKKMEAGMVKLK